MRYGQVKVTSKISFTRDWEKYLFGVPLLLRGTCACIVDKVNQRLSFCLEIQATCSRVPVKLFGKPGITKLFVGIKTSVFCQVRQTYDLLDDCIRSFPRSCPHLCVWLLGKLPQLAGS
uniref:Uncharacterized protein n=1 Tax=Rhizophora mucronata TaxID=61149 RepID=A0A2P2NNN5_RHIMU